MTYHKSQGQTLQKVVLDTRTGVFSHGILYVGLSRVTHCDNIAIFSHRQHDHTYDPSATTEPWPTTINIVYPEMLSIVPPSH